MLNLKPLEKKANLDYMLRAPTKESFNSELKHCAQPSKQELFNWLKCGSNLNQVEAFIDFIYFFVSNLVLEPTLVPVLLPPPLAS